MSSFSLDENKRGKFPLTTTTVARHVYLSHGVNRHKGATRRTGKKMFLKFYLAARCNQVVDTEVASKSAICVRHAILAAANRVGIAPEDAAEAAQTVANAISTFHCEILAALTRAEATPLCVPEAAQNVLNDVIGFYLAVFAAAIRAKASPVVASEAAPGIFGTVSKFYCAVFAGATETKISPVDAANITLNAFNVVAGSYCSVFAAASRTNLVENFPFDIALNIFMIATELYRHVLPFQVRSDLNVFNAPIKFYRGIFTVALTQVNLTLNDAANVKQFANFSVSSIYRLVFTAAIQAGAPPAGAVEAALNVLSAADKLHHLIAAAVPVDATPGDAAAAVLDALKTVINVYIIVFSAIKDSVAPMDAADVALDALNITGKFYHDVFAAATKVNAASVRASGIAQRILNFLAGMYRLFFAPAICAGIVPVDAAKAVLTVLNTAGNFYFDGFTAAIRAKAAPNDASNAALSVLCGVDRICRRVFVAAIEAKVTLADAIEAILNLVIAAGDFYHPVFAAAVNAKAPLTCTSNAVFTIPVNVLTRASDATLDAFNILVDTYHRVFDAAIEAKAAPADAIKAALNAHNAVANIYRGTFIAVLEAGVVTDDAFTVAQHAPKTVSDLYFTVFDYFKDNVAPADAIRAALGALTVAGKFYHGVFNATLRLDAEPACAPNVAVNVLANIIGIYHRVFDAIHVGVAPVDTAGAAPVDTAGVAPVDTAGAAPVDTVEVLLGIFNVIDKFYHDVFAAIITINPIPTCARSATLSALSQVDGICLNVSLVLVEVQITPLAAAKTICAAINAFDTIHSEILRGVDVAVTDARRSTGVDTTLSNTCGTIFSLEQSMNTIYQITFDDVRAAAKFAGLDTDTAFSAAEKAAATVRDLYCSEFKKVDTCFDSAGTCGENATALALTLAATVCGAYRDNLVSAFKIDAPTASVLAAQVDDAVERFKKAS